jgi:hypothetical protein
MSVRQQRRRRTVLDGKGKASRRGQPSATADRNAPLDLNQRDKFIQAAREAECDETGEALDEALRTIGKARRPPGS